MYRWFSYGGLMNNMESLPFYCDDYTKVLRIFDKMYNIHPDTAKYFKSMKKLFISFRIDDVVMRLVYFTKDKEILVEFGVLYSIEDYDDAEYPYDTHSQMTLHQYQIAGTLLKQFTEIFNEITKGE